MAPTAARPNRMSVASKRAPGGSRKGGPSQSPKPSGPSVTGVGRLESQEWYHGHLPRVDINRMLVKHGDFLVRYTQVNGDRKYVVSVFWDGKQRHVVLHVNHSGRYSVDPNPQGKRFTSIAELITFFHGHQEPLARPKFPYVLMNPVMRQEWELRHDQILLDKKIGEGAFGEVFLGNLAKDEGQSIPVAIKRSHAQTQLTKEQIGELMTECRLMQKLQHKNIVKVHGVAAETQPIMIVMEFVSGGSLDSYLQKNIGKILPPTKLKFCIGGAAGMAYLHSRTPPQIHRDIAARNMLLGDNDVVKVSDFGLATEGHTFKMTKNTKVPIRWLAPETLTTATYSLKTDVWAFGVMCWEVFMDGTEPYPGMRAMEVGTKVREGYRMSLDEVLCMPPSVRAIVASCWSTDAEQRPDFERLHNELKAAGKALAP